jgi:hypothetical protein
MAKEKVTLRKIPIRILIDTLVEIYEKGADYIDIVGIPDDTQDEIGITVREEYYTTNPENEIGDDNELNDLI